MTEWVYIDNADEARRTWGDRRDLGREEWLAHYAKLRTKRSMRPWYTGEIGCLYGVTIVRSGNDSRMD